MNKTGKQRVYNDDITAAKLQNILQLIPHDFTITVELCGCSVIPVLASIITVDFARKTVNLSGEIVP